MKFKKVQTYIRLFTDLKFAIFVLFLIVFASSLGSIIEQDEPTFFYEEKYPSVHPIYGFVDSKFILQLGLARQCAPVNACGGTRRDLCRNRPHRAH